MRRSLGAFVPLAAALLLGACVGDRDTPASRLSAPAGALAVGNPNACDFNTMIKDGKTAFSNTDPIVGLIGLMQDAYNAKTGGGTAGATPKAFDVLAYIGLKRLTSAQHGTNADVALVVNEVLSQKCSDITVGLPATTVAEFDAEKSLAAGLFEVRGGALAPAAVAFVAATGGGRQQASPVWGVEPQAGCPLANGGCSWPAGRYLIFGYPAAANLHDETAAAPTSFNGSNGFRLGLMPDIANKSVFTVGACINAVGKSGETPVAANLLYHEKGTAAELLGNRSPTFCADGYPVQAMLTTRTWFASLGQRAASWLAPKPAFAKEELEKFSGGGPSGWSPISFATVTGTGTDLAFDKPPKTGVVGQDIALVVRATSDGGNQLPDATIQIDLANNSGVPAGAIILNAPATGVTGLDGSVTIMVRVNKPGGYTFIASGTLVGGASTNTTVTTSVTNVKSK